MMDRIDVLHVEDNRSDIIFFREALAQAGIRYTMHYAKDGFMAMDFLRRRGAFVSAPRPALIILDLNLPRMDGREVLTRVMADDDLRRIPLVVLTGSSMDRDSVTVLGLPDKRFMIKPMLFNDMVEITKAIEAIRVAAALHE